MPQPDPSNAVLAEKIDALACTVHSNFQLNKEDHDKIFEQCSRTNGRVTKLETYKNMVIGALLILNVIVIPVVMMLINKFINK